MNNAGEGVQETHKLSLMDVAAIRCQRTSAEEAWKDVCLKIRQEPKKVRARIRHEATYLRTKENYERTGMVYLRAWETYFEQDGGKNKDFLQYAFEENKLVGLLKQKLGEPKFASEHARINRVIESVKTDIMTNGDKWR